MTATVFETDVVTNVPLVDPISLEARVVGIIPLFTLRQADGTPVTLTWLGNQGAEFQVGAWSEGLTVSIAALHQAQQEAKKVLCGRLRDQGWSFRKIAAVLGLHLRQAERWGGGA